MLHTPLESDKPSILPLHKPTYRKNAALFEDFVAPQKYLLFKSKVRNSDDDDVIPFRPEIALTVSRRNAVDEVKFEEYPPEIPNPLQSPDIPHHTLIPQDLLSLPKMSRVSGAQLRWRPRDSCGGCSDFFPDAVVPDYLNEWFERQIDSIGYKTQIDVVFVVNVLRNMLGKMPGLKEYINELVDQYLDEEKDIALGLVHIYHFSDGSPKYYGLTKNQDEFQSWVEDMAKSASDTVAFQEERSILGAVSWLRVYNMKRPSYREGDKKIHIYIYGERYELYYPNWPSGSNSGNSMLLFCDEYTEEPVPSE